MKKPRRLSLIAVALLAGFWGAVAQDTTHTTQPVPPNEDEAGMQARMRARALHKANQAPAQRMPWPVAPGADTLTMSVPDIDRGVYQGKGRDTGGAIVLKRAGELRQEQTPQGEIVYLLGNVKIIQDSLTMWCDWARHNRQKRVLELYGNVVMIDPTRRLAADEIFYYEEMKRSVARNNVVLERDSVLLTCAQGQYDDVAEVANFETDLVVKDQKRNIVLTGGRGTYETARQFARVPEDPILVRLDSTGTEEARIVGELMEYDAEQGRAYAKDDVKIAWHDIRGFGSELYFYPELDMALLVGEPRVEHARDEVLGDSIWLYMVEDKLDSAVVIGNAIAYTISDSLIATPRSWLKGQRIVLNFQEGEVSRMESRGQAVGVYHVFQEGVDQGSNEVSGDRVVLNVGDGELKSVVVTGGTQGRFLPPHLAGRLRK